MSRENDDACVVRSPDEAQRNPGLIVPHCASLHAGYARLAIITFALALCAGGSPSQIRRTRVRHGAWRRRVVVASVYFGIWCPWPDSNQHDVATNRF